MLNPTKFSYQARVGGKEAFFLPAILWKAPFVEMMTEPGVLSGKQPSFKLIITHTFTQIAQTSQFITLTSTSTIKILLIFLMRAVVFCFDQSLDRQVDREWLVIYLNGMGQFAYRMWWFLTSYTFPVFCSYLNTYSLIIVLLFDALSQVMWPI